MSSRYRHRGEVLRWLAQSISGQITCNANLWRSRGKVNIVQSAAANMMLLCLEHFDGRRFADGVNNV